MSANLCECDHEGYFHKPSCRVAGCKCLAFTPAPQAQPDASEGATHRLKCWPEFFDEVSEGRKPFEIRRNDRGFTVGARLVLVEFIPCKYCAGSGKKWDAGDKAECCEKPHGTFTGREATRTVTYITNFEQRDGVVVMGLSTDQAQEIARLKGEQLADREQTGEAWEQLAATFPAIQVDCDDEIKAAQFIIEEHEKALSALAAAEKRALEAEAKAEQMRAALRKWNARYDNSPEIQLLLGSDPVREFSQAALAGASSSVESVIKSFAKAMEEELLQNARKGDWSEWKPEANEVLRELRYHVQKLEVALDARNPGSVSEFSADVANIAMKAWECFGLLASETRRALEGGK